MPSFPIPSTQPRLALLLTLLALPSAAAATRSFYQTLGVPPTATPTQIKKAYRSLALQHHPDKVPPSQRAQAEHRFKEINKAYEWLSDEKKREMYDRYGEGAGEEASSSSARRPGGGGTRTHFFHPGSGGFSDLFGSAASSSSSSDFGHLDVNEWIRQMMGGVPMGATGEGYSGQRRRQYGGGASSSSAFYPDFEPRPRRQRASPHGPTGARSNEITRPVECTLRELSLGCTKKFKVSFPDVGEKVYTVRIRPGWKEGTKIKFSGEPLDAAREDGRHCPPVTFVVREKEHPYLKRRGDDLHWKCRLTSRQGERGAKLRLPLPDGSVLEVRSEAGTRSGDRMTVSGRGMLGKSGRKGDVVIEFLVGD